MGDTTTDKRPAGNANTNRKYAYKQLPPFNPTYYHSWAMDVELAFSERKWMPYLTPPTTESPHDPETTIQTTAFLSQSIPLEHKAAIRQCKTAHDIWRIFQQRYASKTREDEVRLEAQLIDLKKSSTETLDQHITKFDNLIAAIRDQQPADRQYDDIKINQYFIRTLEMSNIPNEDWKGFVTFQGKSWYSITKDQLYSEARTYYNTHIVPHLSTTKTPATTQPQSNEHKALTIGTQPTNPTKNNNNDDNNNNTNRGRGRGRGRGRDQHQGRGRGRGNYSHQRNEYPRDPNA
jgi:hypothetical protein